MLQTDRRKFLENSLTLTLAAAFSPAAYASPITDSAPALNSDKINPTLTPPERNTGLQYCALDAHDGSILFGERAHDPCLPASEVKMAPIALLFALMQDNPKIIYDQVIVPRGINDHINTIDFDLARMTYLKEEHNYPFYVLLQGMTARSCATSTYALINHIGDQLRWGRTLDQRTQRGITEMNALADRLNMGSTHFNGLTGHTTEQSVSTPYDMGVLVQYLQNYFPALCKKYLGDPRPSLDPYTKVSYNTSRIIREGLSDWSKTGTTDNAGACEATCKIVKLPNGQHIPLAITVFGAKGSIERRDTIIGLIEDSQPVISKKYVTQVARNNATPAEFNQP